MAYEKVNDLGTDVVHKLGGTDKNGKPAPKQMEGYYLGSRPVVTSNGPAVIHVFQTPKGNEGIWGTKKLNDNLTVKLIGSMVLVQYKGKKKLTGGKTQHEYDISVDKSNTIDVVGLDAAAEEDSADDFETAEDSELSNEEEPEDEAVLLAQQQSAEARKQRVQSLLKGKKA